MPIGLTPPPIAGNGPGVDSNDVSNFATFNVKAFGANGNATGDDGPAIQAAVDAAAAYTALNDHGTVVWFPPGRYRVVTGVNIKGTRVNLLVQMQPTS